jgi:hypothetical protein
MINGILIALAVVLAFILGSIFGGLERTRPHVSFRERRREALRKRSIL